ncbi:MAG: FAD-dependent oxidoreductase [Planctomycetales bacterium]|nr:FAD-dependent oxidoreductase [Planctomycetales bacterium]
MRSLIRQLRRLSERPTCSRREVLAAALAGSSGLLLQQQLYSATNQGKRKVIVVGAGLAGLACADELAHAGYQVTVLESRNRVGGRVHTHSDVIPGKVVEGGGELVGPNQPTWMAYANRFGLTLLPFETETDDTHGVFEIDGSLLSAEAAKSLASEMDTALRSLNALADPVPAYSPWDAPGAIGLDNQSFDDWISRQEVSDTCRRVMRVESTAINGIVPAWQSLLANLSIIKGGGLDKFWDETDTLHVAGGTQQLANLLVDSLKQRAGSEVVRLKQPVLGITIHKGHVEVRLQNKQLEADDVVVTTPPSVLNKIAFAPPLPAGIMVPMANSIKYVAVSSERHWKQAMRSVNATSSGPVQLTWETTAGQGSDGEHGIVAYSSGREAETCRSWVRDGSAEMEYEKRLKAFWGNGYEQKKGQVFDWLVDPYARGAYSFPSPGQVTQAGPLLAKGVSGRIHFAGEHCCFAFIGWMEGALSSGVRLARRICERDGLISPVAQ